MDIGLHPGIRRGWVAGSPETRGDGYAVDVFIGSPQAPVFGRVKDRPAAPAASVPARVLEAGEGRSKLRACTLVVWGKGGFKLAGSDIVSARPTPRPIRRTPPARLRTPPLKPHG